MSDRPNRRDDADIEAMLRELDAENIELLEPPEALWEGIESVIGVPTEVERDGGDDVIPLRSRRRRARRIVFASAAALALVIAGVAAYAITRDDPDVVVARAALTYDADGFDPLGARAQTTAELVANNGHHRIQLVEAALPAAGADADLEAWLIRPDDQGNVADLVSLGLVDPAEPGSFAVPPGYDPFLYSVVDISIEPRDGDPAHSGRSILRGMLDDT